MSEFRHCMNCEYCRYSKRYDYWWCIDRSENDRWEVNPETDGCTFGKDIEPDYQDEDGAYERKKYPVD